MVWDCVIVLIVFVARAATNLGTRRLGGVAKAHEAEGLRLARDGVCLDLSSPAGMTNIMHAEVR